jgi:hypothetical protein
MTHAKSSFFVPKEMARSMTGNGEKAAQEQRIRVPRTKEPFTITPESHLELLASCKSSAVFAVYQVLYLTWCSSLKKYNPVKLNTGRLLRWGYHHRTIRHALDELEDCGLIQVTRKPGNSPVVFLTWKEKRERD